MPDAEIATLADDYARFFLDDAGLWATMRGDLERIEVWEDFSPAGLARRLEVFEGFAARATRLGRGTVGMDRTLTTSIAFNARAARVQYPMWGQLYFVQGSSNLVSMLANAVARYRLVTADHGAAYVAKLSALPDFLDRWCAGVRAGSHAGHTLTGRGVSDTLAEIDGWLARPLADDPLAAQAPPTELTTAEAARWREAVGDVVRDAVRPALAAVRSMYVDDLRSSARPDEQAGICHRVDGEEEYQRLLWAYTSTALTPGEIHQLGIDTLAALDDEWATLGPAALGVSDPAAARARVRDDPALQQDSADGIVAESAAVLERAWSLAGRWFRRTPTAGCDVLGVHGGPAAYYVSPPSDLSAPGKFCINVAEPQRWSRVDLAATACHEGIPGHHLQLALMLESDVHPALREIAVGSTTEGWGLYAERLAAEMGVYETPLQELGMVMLDALRASRLVVDTGLHAFGWSRQQAIDFFEAHTPMSHAAVVAEIDRYIADPGQATSYMVGRVVIDELRAKAAAALGERFRLPDLHDVLLGSGSPPLDELRLLVDEWIDSTV